MTTNASAKASMRPSPLGRGLSALLGDTDTAYQPRHTATGAAAAANSPEQQALGSGVRLLSITVLRPGRYQPRHRFDTEAITELADSIRERGVIQPLLVRPLPENGQYEIVAGERRWRAAQQAGVHDIPVVIRPMSDREAMEIGLIENIQRQDLSPLDEAEGYRRLLDEFGHTQDELAHNLGKSRPYITNMLRLLTLPDGVQKLLNDGKISTGIARAIVTSPDPTRLAEEAVRRGLNVRQVEALSRIETKGRFMKPKKPEQQGATEGDTIALEQSIARATGLKTKLRHSANNSGTITLYYSDLDQLDNLAKRLQG